MALYQITSPKFCAGLVTSNGHVTRCAPILRRLLQRRSLSYVCWVCARKGWKLDLVIT